MSHYLSVLDTICGAVRLVGGLQTCLVHAVAIFKILRYADIGLNIRTILRGDCGLVHHTVLVASPGTGQFSFFYFCQLQLGGDFVFLQWLASVLTNCVLQCNCRCSAGICS